MTFSYGAREPIVHPSAWQFKDHPLRAQAATVRPSKIDLFAAYTPMLKNQGATNSCVGHSLSTLLEVLFFLRNTSTPAVNLSAMMPWIEALAREQNGTITSYDGVYPHDACDLTRALGICVDPLMPWSINPGMPSAAALADAKPRAGLTFWQCQSLEEIKVAASMPLTAVQFCLAVHPGFEAPQVNGICADVTSGTILGYHAVAYRGYDDTQPGGRNGLRNSWGQMADNGTWWLSDGQIQAIMSEAWAVQLSPLAPPPVPPSNPVHDRYAPFFNWLRQVDPATKATYDGWENDLDTNCVLKG